MCLHLLQRAFSNVSLAFNHFCSNDQNRATRPCSIANPPTSIQLTTAQPALPGFAVGAAVVVVPFPGTCVLFPDPGVVDVVAFGLAVGVLTEPVVELTGTDVVGVVAFELTVVVELSTGVVTETVVVVTLVDGAVVVVVVPF